MMVKKAVVFVVGLMNVAWGELMPAPEGAVAARSRQAAVMSIPSGADMLAVVPADVLGEIFQYLGPEDVGRLSQVSKGCRQAIHLAQAEPVHLYRLMMQSGDPRFFKEYMRPPMPILGYSVLADLRHKFGSYKRLYEIKFMDGVFAKEHVAQYREMIKKLDAKAEELKGQNNKGLWQSFAFKFIRPHDYNLCEFEKYRIPPFHYQWQDLEGDQSVIKVCKEHCRLPYANAFYSPKEALSPKSPAKWAEKEFEIRDNVNLVQLLQFGLPPRWTGEILVIKNIPLLKELPPWVLQIQGLQELVLENTGMTTLYPNLCALTSVTRLVMRNQPLQNLDFVILAELAKKVPVVVIEKGRCPIRPIRRPALFISEQSLNGFNVAHLLQFEGVKGLKLKKCALTDDSFRLPKYFDTSNLGRLTSLESIILNNNNLTKVPEVLKHLPNLRFLGLFGNGIQSMKQSVSTLRGLEALDCLNLSNNKLKDISFLKELTSLTNLQIVRLANNQIPIATEREHWEIQGRTILIELEGNPKRPRPLSISHTIAPRTPPAPTPAGMFAVIEQYLSRWWE
jgi:hypothetical protein